MNKTKRKIFETSMKLFAEKGYDATSIEEITATVGVAKGTLYYHFSSKEEIINFLIEEGMKLLKNSIAIKTAGKENCLEKLKAITLIQIKIMVKYENLISIVLSQMWGNEPRNKLCQKYVLEYIKIIEEIVEDGMKNCQIESADSAVLASEIFALTCTSLVYKIKTEKEININALYKEYEKTLLNKLSIK